MVEVGCVGVVLRFFDVGFKFQLSGVECFATEERLAAHATRRVVTDNTTKRRFLEPVLILVKREAGSLSVCFTSYFTHGRNPQSPSPSTARNTIISYSYIFLFYPLPKKKIAPPPLYMQCPVSAGQAQPHTIIAAVAPCLTTKGRCNTRTRPTPARPKTEEREEKKKNKNTKLKDARGVSQ